MADADFVLKNFDDKNVKMLYRRSHALKHFQRYEDAAKDLQTLLKLTPEDKQIKKDLDECLTKLVEQKKQNPSDQKVKIQEIGSETKL